MAAQWPGHIHRREPTEPYGSRVPGQMHPRTVAQVSTTYPVRPMPQGHAAATHPWHTPHTEKCSSQTAPQHHTALHGTLAPNSISNNSIPNTVAQTQRPAVGACALSTKEPKCLHLTFHSAPLAPRASPEAGEKPDSPSSRLCPATKTSALVSWAPPEVRFRTRPFS